MSEAKRADLLRLTVRRWVWAIAGASALVLAVDAAASIAMVPTPPVGLYGPDSPYGVGGWLALSVAPRWLSLARIGAYALAGVFATLLLRRGRNGAIVLVCAWVVDAVGVGVMPSGLPVGGSGAPIVGMVAAMVVGWLRPSPSLEEELSFATHVPSSEGLTAVIAATGVGPVATVPDLRLVDDPDARRGAYARRRGI